MPQRHQPLPPAHSDEAQDLLERFRASCSRYGVDRRRFISLVTAGAAGGFLAACATQGEHSATASRSSDAPASVFFKDTTDFIPHGARNLEARIDRLDSFLTPASQFFVRNNSSSIAVDVDRYALRIEGPGVDKPIDLTLEQLQTLPRRSVFAYVECGGNQRSFFELLLGQVATGTQWGRGGIGMAEWGGVPLGEVLRLAELRDDAVEAQLIGLDSESPEEGFRRPIPIAKALDPDTILADRMNGEVLPPDHGHPLRAVVPGWVGSTNIKWLGRIVVATEKIWSRNNTTSYVLIGDAYPPEGEALGRPATLQSIKSVLALPWPVRLSPGAMTLRGFAHSPHAPIARVLWSVDDGATWSEAQLLEPVMRYAWTRFEIEWVASSGAHTMITRATDVAGNTQPDDIPFNEKGYLFNLPLPHPISVA